MPPASRGLLAVSPRYADFPCPPSTRNFPADQTELRRTPCSRFTQRASAPKVDKSDSEAGIV
jgi:hypothetical protein